MDTEISEDLEIKTEILTGTLSKEESINLLKSKGIIHIPTKKQELVIEEETDDGRIIYSGEDVVKFGETVRKIGAVNEDTHVFSWKCKIKTFCFKLSPSLEIFNSNNNKMSFSGCFLDKDIIYNDGYVEFCESNIDKEKSEILNYFNRLISIFNIITIPFDFVHDYELISLLDFNFQNGIHKEDVYCITSQKAHSRGEEYKAIKLKIDDLEDLILSLNLVWDSLRENEILNTGSLFIFLGYGKYYHFHGDYLLSFANTWMFIEAVISSMWDKMMSDNGFSNRYLKDNSRNWTAQIKIDELRLKGFMDEKTSVEAQNMRTTRNKLFHVSKDESKRKIDEKLSKECIDLGLKLFYQNLGLFDSSYVISFDSIASYVEKCIHEPNETTI